MSENPTPDAITASASILRSSNQPVVLDDLAGRKLTVRRLSILDQSRLSRAVGGENATNGDFMRYATFAAMVSHVNDTPYPMPRTLAEVEAGIERLGDEGYLTVAIQHARWTKAANELLEDAFKKFETDVKN